MAEMTIRERVARAIFGRVAPELNWDDVPSGFHEAVYGTVRDVIETMHEPTEAMIEAAAKATYDARSHGDERWPEVGTSVYADGLRESARVTYRAAIEAVLAE